MRLELTRVGLLAELANHYTTRGALLNSLSDMFKFIHTANMSRLSEPMIGDALLNSFSQSLMVGCYGIATLRGYLIPNPPYSG